MIYRKLVTLLFAVVVVMGCTQASFRQSDVRSFQTLDEMFYEVARLAPDFGGAFYDAKGRMTINLVPAREGMQEAQRRRVLDALAQVFGKSFLRPAHSPSRDPAAQSELVFLPAKYGYGELFEHYTTINPVYRLKGVLYTDIDERANRITIGVSNLEEYRSLIASILSDQSVPTDMVDVIEGDIMYNLWSGSGAAADGWRYRDSKPQWQSMHARHQRHPPRFFQSQAGIHYEFPLYACHGDPGARCVRTAVGRRGNRRGVPGSTADRKYRLP